MYAYNLTSSLFLHHVPKHCPKLNFSPPWLDAVACPHQAQLCTTNESSCTATSFRIVIGYDSRLQLVFCYLSQQPQIVRLSILEFTTKWTDKILQSKIIKSGVSVSLNQNATFLHSPTLRFPLCLVCVLFLTAAEKVLMIELLLILKVAHTEAHTEGGRGGGVVRQQTDTRCFHTIQPAQQKQDQCTQYSMSVCVCNYYPGQGMPIAWVAQEEFDGGSESRNRSRFERFVICALW